MAYSDSANPPTAPRGSIPTAMWIALIVLIVVCAVLGTLLFVTNNSLSDTRARLGASEGSLNNSRLSLSAARQESQRLAAEKTTLQNQEGAIAQVAVDCRDATGKAHLMLNVLVEMIHAENSGHSAQALYSLSRVSTLYQPTSAAIGSCESDLPNLPTGSAPTA